MRKLTRLHGIPKEIISNRDTKFTSKFWRGWFKGFGINMNFSTSYHPQSDGNIEIVNQVIGYMLRMYVMDKPYQEGYFHLVEFDYNNGYHDSLNMSPFEALYGRKCNTPVSWEALVDRVVLKLEFLIEMEAKWVKIKQNLMATQDKKKIYADKR
jgi:transposase InsO family protein